MLTSVRILVRAARQWSANGDSRLGAALAYYALFSIAPVLVIAITIAGVVYSEEDAQGKVQEYLSKYIEPGSAAVIENLVDAASKSPGATSARLLSIVALVYGALGAFVHMRTSLCLIWKLEPPHVNTVLATLLDYGLAIVMVLVTGALLIASVAAGVVMQVAHDYVNRHFSSEPFPWSWLEFVVSILFLTVVFAATYWILSDRRIPLRYVVYGSVIAALLFTVGKFLLSYYLVYAGIATTYGAAGSLVVFLVWVYYSSQTLFFGAELIQARRTRGEWMKRAG